MLQYGWFLVWIADVTVWMVLGMDADGIGGCLYGWLMVPLVDGIDG